MTLLAFLRSVSIIQWLCHAFRLRQTAQQALALTFRAECLLFKVSQLPVAIIQGLCTHTHRDKTLPHIPSCALNLICGTIACFSWTNWMSTASFNIHPSNAAAGLNKHLSAEALRFKKSNTSTVSSKFTRLSSKGRQYILFGLDGNIIGAQKPTKTKCMPVNSLVNTNNTAVGITQNRSSEARLAA